MSWLHPVQIDRSTIDSIVAAKSKKKLMRLLGQNCYKSPDPKVLKKRMRRFNSFRLMGRDFDVTITIDQDVWSVTENT